MIQTKITDFDDTIAHVHYPTMADYTRYKHTTLKEIFKHKKYKTVRLVKHFLNGAIIDQTYKEKEQ